MQKKEKKVISPTIPVKQMVIPPEKRMIMYLRVEFLLELITGKTQIVNLPPRCNLININWDIETASFAILLESEDFPITAPGYCYPCFIAECIKAV